MRWVPSGSEILLGDEKVKRVIHWVLSSRFAVEVCFSNFRPEFFENLVTKKGEKAFLGQFWNYFFAVEVRMFLPFWDLSFSKKAEFCQNPEFLLGLSFSQNVEKKSLL